MITQSERVLRDYGIPESTIAEMRRTGRATRSITVVAPRNGVVLEKPAIEGMHFNTGDPLFRIADLSTVWLIAEIQEQDLGIIRTGAPVQISFAAYPGRSFSGRTNFIYPAVNPATRTGRVRIVVPNPDGHCGESMFAIVDIATQAASGAKVLVVPDSAVIDSGTRQVVLIERGQGRFEPRTVQVGARGDGLRTSLDGVKAGERRCHQRQFPDRRGKQSARRRCQAFAPAAAGTDQRARTAAMIAAHHPLVQPEYSCRPAGDGVRIVGVGIYAVVNTPLDAIPDLSDAQVIVYTEYPGQAPQVVEDQVTYPLTTALLAVPRSQGGARVFVFRRVLRLRHLRGRHRHLLGAQPRARISELRRRSACRRRHAVARTRCDRRRLGLQYAVIGAQARRWPSCGRMQDWYLRYQLTKARGVAEVASVGGFVQQYQVDVDPDKLRAYGIPLVQVTEAIRASNMDVGGRVIEMAETRIHGARPRLSAAAPAIIEQIVLKCDRTARRCCCATWRGSSSGPTSGAASPN